jgi:hypothetical protein
MRKIILVAAMVLVSASAQASGSRGLILASADDPAAAPQATQAVPSTEAPKYVDRPSAASTTPPAASPAAASTTQGAKPAIAKADKPKHRRYWTEGRIISELHRHGSYW